MKSRLESAPITDEDRLCWLRAYCRLADRTARGYEKIVYLYRSADRRDADIMMMLGNARLESGGHMASLWLATGYDTSHVAGWLRVAGWKPLST